MDIHALVEEKLAADADFLAEIESLSDEEREQALADKKAELVNKTFAELDEKARKAEEIAQNQKIRAEKAERAAKTAKPAGEEAPKTPDNLSIRDFRALQDVPEEDIEEVIDFAKFKNISVSEAKKHPAVQSLLKTREEERKTAAATNTGTTRRAVSRNTPDAILERAKAGQLPESDEDIQKLAEARLAEKMARSRQ